MACSGLTGGGPHYCLLRTLQVYSWSPLCPLCPHSVHVSPCYCVTMVTVPRPGFPSWFQLLVLLLWRPELELVLGSARWCSGQSVASEDPV